MSQCRIILDNYNGTYHNDDTIIGRVDCYFDHDINVRAVKICVRCNEHNQWTDSEEYLDDSDNKYKTRWVEFVGDKDVLCMEQKLYTSAHNEPLVRGQHAFPFTIDLPEKIPSTFNGPHGSIRYEVIAVVDIPLRIDYEDRFIINVVSLIDLNQFPDTSFNEVNYEDETTMCCWCCQSGSISMDVDFPKIAFVPGEIMNFNVKISNMSNENVENIHVSFDKNIRYSVSSPSHREKIDHENIATIDDHGVGAHGEHIYNMEITVPEYLEIPNFDICGLFSATYKIEINAKTPSCTTDLNVVIYPEFGHIQRGQGKPHSQPGFVPFANDGYSPSTDNYYPSPPIGGAHPPPAVGDAYPPPTMAGGYPPATGGAYPPPPTGGVYPPPQTGGVYPPPQTGGVYPPAQTGGVYPPPPTGGVYPPPPTGGAYSPASASSGYPPSNLPYGGAQHPKATEGYQNTAPTAPPPSELPPPSYDEIHKNNPPYPPQ